MALHFAEQKVNWLTHDVTDSLIGTPEFKVSAVRVERAGDFATVCCKLSVNDTLAPDAVEPHLERSLREAVPVRAGVRVDAAAPARRRACQRAPSPPTDHQTGGRGRLGRAVA